MSDLEQMQEKVAELVYQLGQAQGMISEQAFAINKLTAPPLLTARVLEIFPPQNPAKKDYIDELVLITGEGDHKGLYGVCQETQEVKLTQAQRAQRKNKKKITQYYIRFLYDPQRGVWLEKDQIKLMRTPPDREGFVRVALHDKIVLAFYPDKNVINRPLRVGEEVMVHEESNSIVRVGGETSTTLGEIGIVGKVHPGGTCEVEVSGANKTVVYNDNMLPGELKKGDRVITDSLVTVVLNNFGTGNTRWNYESSSGITWDDVGGLEQAKAVLREAVETPLQNPEVYEKYGKKPIKGVLLYGPPGCGKTMLGKAAATAIAELHGTKDGSFIYVKGPELLSKWVGETEAWIRSLFALAREYKKEKGFAPILFIDEADAILSSRGSRTTSGMERTVVPMFLAEMDGLDDQAALVILATNRADQLDSAVVRDQRIDRKVRVTRPTLGSTEEILSMNLASTPLSNGYSVEELAKFTAGRLMHEDLAMYKVKCKNGGVHTLHFKDMVNGGMLVSVVDLATSKAMHRDMAAKQEAPGLKKQDLSAAVHEVFLQNMGLDHNELLREFQETLDSEITDIQSVARR